MPFVDASHLVYQYIDPVEMQTTHMCRRTLKRYIAVNLRYTLLTLNAFVFIGPTYTITEVTTVAIILPSFCDGIIVAIAAPRTLCDV